MNAIRVVTAMVLALVAGFLVVGPAVVAATALLDTSTPLEFHGGWPVALGGVVLGIGFLAASAKLLVRV